MAERQGFRLWKHIVVMKPILSSTEAEMKRDGGEVYCQQG